MVRKSIITDISVRASRPVVEQPCPAVSRGVILSGVLKGTCSYDTIPIMTDTPVCPNEPGIDYDPSSDQRLDRFDAMEMSISEIDDKVPTPSPSVGSSDISSEKKE